MDENIDIDWKEIFKKLKTPFDSKDIQFRVGATTKDKKKAQALPYADSRVYEDRLDEVVGPNWSVTFRPWGDKIICDLMICHICRSSTGECSGNDGGPCGTTAEAQAFKRACSKWGLGRYVYEHKPEWVPYDSAKRKFLQTPKPIGPTRATTNTVIRNTITEDNASDFVASVKKEVGHLPPSSLMRIVSNCVARKVKSLTELTRAEAKMVYHFMLDGSLKLEDWSMDEFELRLCHLGFVGQKLESLISAVIGKKSSLTDLSRSMYEAVHTAAEEVANGAYKLENGELVSIKETEDKITSSTTFDKLKE